LIALTAIYLGAEAQARKRSVPKSETISDFEKKLISPEG
jgi:hypothetical protein